MLFRSERHCIMPTRTHHRLLRIGEFRLSPKLRRRVAGSFEELSIVGVGYLAPRQTKAVHPDFAARAFVVLADSVGRAAPEPAFRYGDGLHWWSLTRAKIVLTNRTIGEGFF